MSKMNNFKRKIKKKKYKKYDIININPLRFMEKIPNK